MSRMAVDVLVPYVFMTKENHYTCVCHFGLMIIDYTIRGPPHVHDAYCLEEFLVEFWVIQMLELSICVCLSSFRIKTGCAG